MIILYLFSKIPSINNINQKYIKGIDLEINHNLILIIIFLLIIPILTPIPLLIKTIF